MQTKQDFDLKEYEERARNGPCFICELINGNPKYSHHLIFEDEKHIAFLNKYPTVPGYVIVCPKIHVADYSAEMSEEEYLAFQSLMFSISSTLQHTFDAERIYQLSLGSAQGNSHVHFHLVPLPKGVPYEQQQYYTLMAENGVLAITQDEFRSIAEKIKSNLALSAGEQF